MKTGRLSKQEWEYIDKHADTLSLSEIALNLNRDEEPVRKYLLKIGKGQEPEKSYKVQAEYDLKSRPYWRELKLQFEEHELELLLYHWSQIIAQFKMDVTPTEELQILDAAKLEVLMNRALREQMNSMNNVKMFQKELEKEKRKTINLPPPDGQDRELIFSLERQITVLHAAKEALGKDFKELQTRKNAILKDMKATRDQRFDRVQSNKQTWSSLMEELLTRADKKEQYSLEMEKMRLAIEQEKQRLSELHSFMDNEVDKCLLNEETV